MTVELLAAVVALLVAACVVPVARRVALRRGLLDVPNERSSHTQPTPRTGGMGILAGMLCSVAVAALLRPSWRAHWLLFVILLGGAAVGFLDDLVHLKTAVRLPLYLGLGILLARSSARVEIFWLPGLPQVPLGRSGGIVFSTLFSAWYANLFNFMDGIDGIAGTTAVVTHAALGIALLPRQRAALATLAFAAVGSSLGFLLYNFPPASVFMGDGGAVYLGFSAAALSLGAVHEKACSLPAGVLFMFPFVFDATFTLLRRIIAKERFWAAHRSHIYQQLCDLGFSHRSVTAIFTLLGVACAGVGLALDRWTLSLQVLAWWGAVAFFLAGAIYVVLANRRRQATKEALPRGQAPARR